MYCSGLMTDAEIRREVIRSEKWSKRNFISPFLGEKISKHGLSFGLSSHGYDARLGYEFKSQLGGETNLIEPDHLDSTLHWQTHRVESSIIINPGDFFLAHTIESFCLTPSITGLVCDKSTYARMGLAVQNTVLEAGWYGQITLELSNHGKQPILLIPGTGIVQVIFFRSDSCEVPYQGKYQDQEGVVGPR